MTDAVQHIEELRQWALEERARGRARMKVLDLPEEQIAALLAQASQMHDAQIEAVARQAGLSPAVVVH